MKTFLLTPLLLLCAAHIAQAQTPDSLWRPFDYLAGEWTAADAQGAPQPASGTASFAFDLSKHVLIRKNHAVSAASGTRPASVHDDILTVYYEPGRGMRALYVDNESHVIHYQVRATASGDTIEFLGDKQPGAPRFRLLYLRTGERTADVSFDMAMPDAPDTFRHYVTGRIVKK